jgi:ribokinase
VRVVVVGSVNLDLVATVSRQPEPGETVAATGFARVPGGKGANQALAARRLGGQVRLVAAVGEDPEAGQALALLRAGGVDLSRLRRHGDAGTGLALITVDAAGENTIVVVAAANGRLDVEPADLAGADVVLCQLEVPLPAVAAAARYCPPGALLCLNAAPVPADGRIPDDVLDRADLVVANRAERAALPDLARARLLAVTAGGEGAVLVERGREVARAAAPEVSVVDGTGAGDAFVAALALGLRAGLDRDAGLRRACAAGALAATRSGAQPSLPTADDVDALLARSGATP